MDILKTLAEEFSIKEEQVKDTVALIDEGNTIPFISRYRKEVTGGLDDATLREAVRMSVPEKFLELNLKAFDLGASHSA